MDEYEKNPWTVTTLDVFLYFCCPECDTRKDSKMSFLEHALIEHPKAKSLPESIKSLHFGNSKPIKNEMIDIKQEVLENNHKPFIPDASFADDFPEVDVAIDYDDSGESIDDDDEDENTNGNDDEDWDYNAQNTKNDLRTKQDDNETYSCNICNKIFDNFSRFAIHARIGHKKFSESEQSPPVSKPTPRKQSKPSNNNSFPNESEGSEISVASKIANKIVTMKSLQPAEDAILPCEYCGLSFASCQLQQHINKEHLKEQKKRDHVCDICGKAYGYKQQLKRHKDSVHDGKVNKVLCNE